MDEGPDITVWLDSARAGDRAALDRVLTLLYHELHSMARRASATKIQYSPQVPICGLLGWAAAIFWRSAGSVMRMMV